MIFIYKALLNVLPDYLNNFISFRTSNLHTFSLESLISNIPNVRTEFGKTAFQVCAPQKWNDLQLALGLNHLISLDSFKCLFFNVLQSDCNCNL